MGSPEAASCSSRPNSRRIRGLGRHRLRRRTTVRPPLRRLAWPSSRFMRTFNVRYCGYLLG